MLRDDYNFDEGTGYGVMVLYTTIQQVSINHISGQLNLRFTRQLEALARISFSLTPLT